jgi:hypothetical protein
MPSRPKNLSPKYAKQSEAQGALINKIIMNQFQAKAREN